MPRSGSSPSKSSLPAARFNGSNCPDGVISQETCRLNSTTYSASRSEQRAGAEPTLRSREYQRRPTLPRRDLNVRYRHRPCLLGRGTMKYCGDGSRYLVPPDESHLGLYLSDDRSVMARHDGILSRRAYFLWDLVLPMKLPLESEQVSQEFQPPCSANGNIVGEEEHFLARVALFVDLWVCQIQSEKASMAVNVLIDLGLCRAVLCWQSTPFAIQLPQLGFCESHFN